MMICGTREEKPWRREGLKSDSKHKIRQIEKKYGLQLSVLVTTISPAICVSNDNISPAKTQIERNS